MNSNLLHTRIHIFVFLILTYIILHIFLLFFLHILLKPIKYILFIVPRLMI